MKTITRSVLLLFVLFVALSAGYVRANGPGHGNSNPYNKFSFGLGGGMFTSLTDVKELPLLPDPDEITYGGRLTLNVHLSPVLTLQGNVLYGGLKGIETENNLEFETDLIESTLNMRISLNSLFVPASRVNQSVNLYAFIGAGVLTYRSRLLQGGVPIRYYGYEDGGQTPDGLLPEFVAPYGMGVNFRLSERLDLGIETGFRYTSSDRLDAWPVTGSRHDMYNFTSVGLTFRFGKNTNSMDWAPMDRAMYPGDVDRLDALGHDLVNLEEGLAGVQTQHDTDVETVHRDVRQLTQKQEELNRRSEQVFRALEDITQQMIELEAKIDAQPERYYSVQVMALREELSLADARSYLGINKDLEMVYADGWYKYYSGRYHNLEDAILKMQRLWGQGVRDAFVVKCEDGVFRPR